MVETARAARGSFDVRGLNAWDAPIRILTELAGAQQLDDEEMLVPVDLHAPSALGVIAPVLGVVESRDEVHEKRLDALSRKAADVKYRERILSTRIRDKETLGIREPALVAFSDRWQTAPLLLLQRSLLAAGLTSTLFLFRIRALLESDLARTNWSVEHG